MDDDEVTVIHHNHVNHDAIRVFTPVLIRVSPARKRSGREVVGRVLTWAELASRLLSSQCEGQSSAKTTFR
ncbi:auxin transporter-like protein 1 [Musa troglodytarum]|uniref:Auxin transporter-like protein 1 n=1 Tax=Musa troglodytarum TaxID=320322 RepID=A0A9E7EL27_9LILI|nr:auxin transporter-like protein 1 [Musa troglodytarum]